MPRTDLEDVFVEQPTSNTAVVVFKGEHDLASREDVCELLCSLVGRHDLVVADFSSAQFVDSSMLRALLDVNEDARARGSTFRLPLNTAAIVRRAFDISGVCDLIGVAATRAEALGERLQRGWIQHHTSSSTRRFFESYVARLPIG